ncbi:hypothetical protein FVEN_g6362 [Fusarium venenatum]|uniref:Uncharacterized protein n=1 Tax=Fusarium venenatum TaxID=56646 RepID=A0A2L2SUS7_9HYPO|nr:uncharacterized protein FVRRES_04614 [Fusarium venenatum]KAG8355643.1 hypothetical protein FVEN_g6362 [Fusarium venenatum]KAH6991770.1 hypothetical protein EDB82DRAFT_494468 [Fusarium venenatum]CEI60178.1 unnamed protein product [Fusarium venenatum]
MGDNETGAISALGALLGYVGAEAATTAPFGHLLWPQRHLDHPSWQSAFMAALLMPMGGPLHKAALETFDTLHRHGLFRGAYKGHMLGTAFFNDIGWTYTMHDMGVKGLPKAVRNCIWTRAMSLLEHPQLNDGSMMLPMEKKEQSKAKRQSSVRAWISCYHLTFSQATEDDRSSALPFVRERVNTPGPQVYLSLLAAESSAIIIAIILIVIWRTPWVTLWLAPLALRLISTFFAIHREPLETLQLTPQNYTCDFEIHCPESNGDFIVLSGPPPLIQQFMRHYGHPCRSRTKEIIQLVIICALGCVFPAGLVASALFMPLHLQYVWFGYQIFLVAGLHIARYCQFSRQLSIDAAIAEAFAHGDRFNRCGESSLLFGHKRSGAGILRVDLKVKSYSKYAEGKQAVQKLLMNDDKDIEEAIGSQ